MTWYAGDEFIAADDDAFGPFDEAEYDDYDEWVEPPDRAFCDNYTVHDAHTYWAINTNTYACPGFSQDDADFWAQRAAEPPCEHGLSAWLCSGPNHYGEDDR